MPPEPPKPLKPLSWWYFGLGLVFIAGAITGLYFWLSSATGGVVKEATAAKLRLDVIRTSLTVGAGLGGVAALALAFRRQRATENATAITEYDATQRRITELRIQAVEQLGSENSAVRIGGLHNLERLGEQYVELRQIVFDEICAYLRRPFRLSGETNLLGRIRAYMRASSTPDIDRQERDVRRTAQAILVRHLERPEFWEHGRLDLRGATLDAINFNFCQLNGASFAEANFHGTTRLHRTVFRSGRTKGVDFEKAIFHGHVDATNAEFRCDTHFRGAVFHDSALLLAALFEGQVNLRDVEGTKYVGVDGVTTTARGAQTLFPPDYVIVADPQDPGHRYVVDKDQSARIASV